MTDLSRFRGRRRLLLIFAPSASDEGFGLQRDLLQGHEAGFDDRDLLAFRLFEDGSGDADEEAGDAEEAAAARGDFGVEAGRFAVVLVGKDGTAKFRSREPVPASDLFSRVDAMPMRRREMREKNRG
ncbi:MAG TPA: DUF4174 domain-containing protein [Rubrobacter sp.]|nr:DUF4174 domain-containing protein [Rubrobacter sp.]